MKKLVVRMEFELEVPDHAVLREPAEGLDELLFLHGRYLNPALSWIALSEISGKGSAIFSDLDDKELERMEDCIPVGSIDMQIVEGTDTNQS